MPTYDMKNVKTGEITEMFLKIAEKEKMVESGEWVSVHLGAMKMISQSGSTITKASDGWKDLLKTIKKNSGRGNTIKT
mgnify:CR=1 FL=1